MNSNYTKYIKSYPDFPKPGVIFRDIFPLVGNVKVFHEVVSELAKASQILNPSKLLAIEARGFIIGAALSLEMGIDMVPARKAGKLPGKTISHEYQLEYGTDIMQIPTDSIIPNERILLTDDVLATGGTAKAVTTLIKMAGGVPVGLASIMELSFLKGRQVLENPDFKVLSLIEFSE